MEKVSPDIIGELLLGELRFWITGVCRIESKGDKIVVYGEGGHVVGRVTTGDKLTDNGAVDLDEVSQIVNKIIETEHEQL
jgi:hypothetical protein